MAFQEQAKLLISTLQGLLAKAEAARKAAVSNQQSWITQNIDIEANGRQFTDQGAAELSKLNDAASAAERVLLGLSDYGLAVNKWAPKADVAVKANAVPEPFPQPSADIVAFAGALNVSVKLPPVQPLAVAMTAFTVPGGFLAVMAPSSNLGDTSLIPAAQDNVPIGTVVNTPDGHFYLKHVVQTSAGSANQYTLVV